MRILSYYANYTKGCPITNAFVDAREPIV